MQVGSITAWTKLLDTGYPDQGFSQSSSVPPGMSWISRTYFPIQNHPFLSHSTLYNSDLILEHSVIKYGKELKIYKKFWKELIV
jgi:hypothetical protein